MIKWLMRRRLAAFERSFGYDARYAHDILQASPRGFMALARIQAMGRFRRDVPKDVYYTAKLVAARFEDCGPARNSSPPWPSARACPPRQSAPCSPAMKTP